MTKLEAAMWYHLRAYGIEHVHEYRFYQNRRWKFDFAIPELLIAIECEGGVFTNGRHTRGEGYEKDLEKYNAAALLGWRVLRFSGDMIKVGYAARIIERTIADMRELQSKFGDLPVQFNMLSSTVFSIPPFEKSPRRAVTKMAVKKRRTTTQRKSGGVK